MNVCYLFYVELNYNLFTYLIIKTKFLIYVLFVVNKKRNYAGNSTLVTDRIVLYHLTPLPANTITLTLLTNNVHVIL